MLSCYGSFVGIGIECSRRATRGVDKDHVAIVAGDDRVVQNVPLDAPVHLRRQRVPAADETVRMFVASLHVSRACNRRAIVVEPRLKVGDGGLAVVLATG